MKKKKVMILFFVFVVLGGFFLYFYYHKIGREEKIQDIRSHYASIVQLKHDSDVYVLENGEYQVVGRGAQNLSFALDDLVIDDVKHEYFPVKNEDYFVYYQDVSRVEVEVIDTVPDYYLTSKKRIQTGEKTNFYQNNVLILSLNRSMDFVFVSQNEQTYQVQYLGKIFELKKEEVSLLEETILRDEAEYIPVLYIPEVQEICNDDSCISIKSLEEFLNMMKEKEFYSLKKDDYELWSKGYVSLKKNALVLHFEKVDDIVSSLLEEYGMNAIVDFQYHLSNQSSKVGTNLENVDAYQIHQNTTKEQMEKVLKGEVIEYSKPKEIIQSTSLKKLPNMEEKATNIAVLNYHFFYGDGESCGSGICLEVNKFREQLQFLKDNQYKTLTMEEYRAWMYGEIELPARSVLLTIDDGAMGTGKHNGNKLIPLLEEFDMHATLFLISGWWAKSNYLSDHLDIESHTYDMHTERVCSNQTRGAQMLCSSKEQVMEDLRKSIDIIGSSIAFCFPFYAYNSSAIQSVKEAGFKLAFVGGNRKSNRSNDKYMIPRYPIQGSITLNEFINMIA